MNHEKKAILLYLKELDFAIVETSSYLDSNPTDDNALKLHDIIVEKYRNLESIYESKFGSICPKNII